LPFRKGCQKIPWGRVGREQLNVRAEHYCALAIAVAVASCAGIPAFAQSHEPDNPAPPTIEDVQKLARAISGDKAKLKAYCELGNLYEQLEKAQEKNDTKEFDALGPKIDSLEQQVGPDYRQIMDGLGEVDPNSAEGQKLNAVFEQLQEQCK
jgi:hypothetical protein